LIANQAEGRFASTELSLPMFTFQNGVLSGLLDPLKRVGVSLFVIELKNSSFLISSGTDTYTVFIALLVRGIEFRIGSNCCILSKKKTAKTH
tara:strand:- start:39460 stop:39735 length:276 start_codon:yes stop_codon:yes gene_type:complete